MTTVDDGGRLARDVVAFVWEDWRQRFPIKPAVIRFGPSVKEGEEEEKKNNSNKRK
jgi:hypothetical protein